MFVYNRHTYQAQPTIFFRNTTIKMSSPEHRTLIGFDAEAKHKKEQCV